MKSTVETQVERIIDEGEGRRRSVIVQMGYRRESLEPLVKGLCRAERERALVTSARDLLPAASSALERGKGGKLTTTQRRKLRSAASSLSSQVALVTASSTPARPGKRSLIAEGRRAVKPLHASEAVQKALGSPPRGVAPAKELWSSGSMALEVTPDELRRLTQEVEGIVEVFPNRRLQVPPLVEVDSLPANVADNKTSAWGIRAIGALAAWGAYDARGQGVTVAVLDTGVDGDHPDLDGKVVAFGEFDDNGNEVPGAQTRDTDRHGTHVSGTIVGGNGGGEWIGVAPDAQVAGGVVLPGGTGTDAQILAGMEWAIDQGFDVISMSLGGLTLGPDVPDTYTRTILTAAQVGIPVVIAIGNDGEQTSGAPGNDFFAFAVGATDSHDRAVGFSGGRTQIIRTSPFINPDFLPLVYSKPDVTAPGVAVRSAVPGDGYALFNGTSMATPHVAGAMALLLSATSIRADVPPSEQAFLLYDLLAGSVEELGEAGQDHRFGYGRIDVLRALGFARERGL